MKPNNNAEPVAGELKNLPVRFGLVTLMLGAGLALSTPASAAPPVAGSVISNQASATYVDASAKTQTATSNVVETTVAKVGDFTLDTDNTKTAAVGNTVYMPHTLTNTGNFTDSFTLSMVNNTADTGFEFSAIELYADANKDGIPDSTTPLCSAALPIFAGATTTCATPITLASGGVYTFVTALTVPSGAAIPSGNFDDITVKAKAALSASYPDYSAAPYSDAGGAGVGIRTDTDTVKITNVAAFQVTKSISLDKGPAGQTGLVYTLTYKNIGGAAGTLALKDVIGTAGSSTTGFRYVVNSAEWGNKVGTLITDTDAGPDTIDTSDGSSDFLYKAILGGDGVTTTITADVTNVPANVTGKITFKVDVTALASSTPPGTALVGTSTTTNTAQYATDNNDLISDGTTSTYFNSNPSPYEVLPSRSMIVNDGTQTGLAPVRTLLVDDGNNTLPVSTDDDTAANKDLVYVGTAAPGQTVSFSNTVSNLGDTTDTYNISYKALTTYGTWPAGTTFQIMKSDGAVQLADSNNDNVVDTGPIVAGGSYTIVVKATLPSNAVSSALSDVYDIELKAISIADSSISNVTYDRLRGVAGNKLQIIPNNTGQLNPGGTIAYPHTVKNIGSSSCTDSFTFTINNPVTGWTYTLYEDVNDNGKLDIDTSVPVAQRDTLITPSALYTINPSNLDTLAAGGKLVGITGEFRILVKVFAPGGAKNGDVDTASVSAEGTCGALATSSNTATDITNVVTGDVRLEKTQALDKKCDGVYTVADGDVDYQRTPLTGKPGECILYKVVATNQGLTNITNLVVSDTTPPYTGYAIPTSWVCGTGAAKNLPLAPTVTGVPAGVDGSQNITETCAITPLVPGATTTLDMAVKINEK